MPGGGKSRSEAAASAANLLVALFGLLLILLAALAGPAWTDRHFLPSFALSRAFQVGLVNGLRLLLALVGLFLLLFVRPRIDRAVRGGRGRRLAVSALSATLAVAAAFAVAEAVLHTRTWRATQERLTSKEPLRRRDDVTGWAFVPNHRGTAVGEGRVIDYWMDRFGYRFGGRPLDLDRPTIVLAGESILLGYGLPWPDTIAAHIEAATGMQTANLSVNAYATDQIFMRLSRELPGSLKPTCPVRPMPSSCRSIPPARSITRSYSAQNSPTRSAGTVPSGMWMCARGISMWSNKCSLMHRR